MFLGGINSPHEGLEQKMRDSHGVENCCTALRNSVCSSRVRMDLTIELGIGWVQHLGGILVSSLQDWLIMIRRHLLQ